eukprot:TRINITY_DN133_c0_g1_i6.p2 TRINITY_DN133_c0_g1~~TRINITY_DN133_c0_g1_i6.p2  ORF type:complete len:102 (-),score=40.87 TRINITY_DN133_c0_g1_i6:128-433(-)
MFGRIPSAARNAAPRFTNATFASFFAQSPRATPAQSAKSYFAKENFSGINFSSSVPPMAGAANNSSIIPSMTEEGENSTSGRTASGSTELIVGEDDDDNGS